MVVATLDDERDALSEFSMEDLRSIAEEIGADTARSKAQIVENILAKKTGQPAAVMADQPEEKEETEETVSSEVGAEAQAAAEVEETAEEAPVLAKHLMLTMFERPSGDGAVLDQQGVNERVDEWLAKGYDPIEFQALGNSPIGHKMLWVFKKVDKPKYTRSMHVMRLLTPQANPMRQTFSGFQADAYISAFMEAGWDLIGARYNGDEIVGDQTMGIYMLWMLAK